MNMLKFVEEDDDAEDDDAEDDGGDNSPPPITSVGSFLGSSLFASTLGTEYVAFDSESLIASGDSDTGGDGVIG